MPVVAALVTVLLWSSAFVGIRSAGHDLSAGSLTLARIAVASVVLGIIVLARHEKLPPRRDVARIVFCGLLWLGAYNLMLNAAEQRVDAGTAAMLVNVGPVLIALMAGWLLKEGFPRNLVVGCGIAFAGAIVIGMATRSQSKDAALGALLCLGAALAYAVAVVLQKPLLDRTSGLMITFLFCSVATIACLPFAPGLVHDARHASGGTLAWAVYLGAAPTATGFVTWAYALRHTSAGKMGATTYLVPPLAILQGWVFLGETPPALAFAGGALCLVGVALTRGLRLTTLSEAWVGFRSRTGRAAAATKTS